MSFPPCQPIPKYPKKEHFSNILKHPKNPYIPKITSVLAVLHTQHDTSAETNPPAEPSPAHTPTLKNLQRLLQMLLDCKKYKQFSERWSVHKSR